MFNLAPIDRKVTALQIVDKSASAPVDATRAASLVPASSFSPPLHSVLARRLAAEKIPGLESQPIEISSSEVALAVYRPKHQPSPGAAVFVHGGGVGTHIVANVSANLLIAAIDAMAAKGESLVVTVVMDLKVGDKTYTTAGASHGRFSNAQETVTLAIDNAIISLVERLTPPPNLSGLRDPDESQPTATEVVTKK